MVYLHYSWVKPKYRFQIPPPGVQQLLQYFIYNNYDINSGHGLFLLLYDIYLTDYVNAWHFNSKKIHNPLVTTCLFVCPVNICVRRPTKLVVYCDFISLCGKVRNCINVYATYVSFIRRREENKLLYLSVSRCMCTRVFWNIPKYIWLLHSLKIQRLNGFQDVAQLMKNHSKRVKL